MYAVVASGGKQLRVTPGDSVQVELLDGEVGDSVRLDRVLLVSGEDGPARVGTPHVDGVSVVGTILPSDIARTALDFISTITSPGTNSSVMLSRSAGLAPPGRGCPTESTYVEEFRKSPAQARTSM